MQSGFKDGSSSVAAHLGPGAPLLDSVTSPAADWARDAMRSAVLSLQLLLLSATVVGGSAATLDVCVVDGTQKIQLNEACSSASPGILSLHAMRGEVERAQLLITNNGDSAVDNVTASATGFGGLTGVSVNVQYVGYVYCHESPRYAGSATGWLPDSLWPLPSGGITLAPGSSIALWLQFSVAATAPAATLSGSVAVASSAQPSLVPATVEVWDLTVPAISDASAFSTVYSFSYSSLGAYYGGNFSDAMKHKYFDFLNSKRFPATSLYINEPWPVDDYTYLATQGGRWMNLIDVTSLPLKPGDADEQPRQHQHRAHTGGIGGSCSNYTDEYVSRLIATLEPTVTALQAAGTLDQAYVYGFDECPQSCEFQVRQLFGAVKAKWPALRTMAVLNWDSMPTDIPLDVWVYQYEDYNKAEVDKWVANPSKLAFQYHCIEPSKPGFLNTFIERDAIEARLLFWLAFQTNTTGWLYYAVDLWRQFSPTVSWWDSYTTPDGYSYMVGPHVAGPMEGAPDIRYTNFDPANWIWATQDMWNIWANGDGSFMNAGPDGPIGSIRFDLQSDGVEDLELAKLAAAKDPAAAAQLANSMVRNATDWTNDVAVLQGTRVKLANVALGKSV